MAGRRKPEAVVLPTNSLVASAVRYPQKNQQIYRGAKEWQKEAWKHFHICPELRFAATWIGNSLSRCSLFAATMKGTQRVPAPNGEAADLLDDLFNGSDGQAQMLSALGLHLTVAGEAYLVGRKDGSAYLWEIVGITEMQVTGADSWSINYGDGIAPVRLGTQDTVIRIWRPSPDLRIEADSPVRALLPILVELEFLTRHVWAQITSRLAGAGLLLLDDALEFPVPPAVDGQAQMNKAEAFSRVLGEAMLTPISDPGNASALVPMIALVPGDSIGKTELVKFWTPLDENSMKLREEAIRRLALGMDVPPEVVLGMATSGSAANHWTSWQIEESAIKIHVEPLLELIVNALVTGYIRPVTEALTDTIGYDTSSLRLRPDRSKEALELYALGQINGETLRRETGFSEDAVMNDKETTIWLLNKMASGSATPEQVAWAVKELTGKTPPSDPTDGIREARPAPSLEDHPLPRQAPERKAASLAPVCEAFVFRALERAGNRQRAKLNGRKLPGVRAAETYRFVQVNGDAKELLDDAWGYLSTVLDDQLGVDPLRIQTALESYCIDIMHSKTPHNREVMVSYIEKALV